MDKWSLCLSGPIRLVAPDGREVRIRSVKSRALLVLLATSSTGEQSRVFLRDMLWERSGRTQQLNSLGREISSLTRALRESGAPQLVCSDRQKIWIDKELLALSVSTDRAPQGSPAAAPGADFLADIDLPGYRKWNEWVARQRREFEGGLTTFAMTARASERAYGGPVPPAAEILGSVRLSRPPKPSVAVLPFLTGSGSDGELGLALADGLAVGLAHFPQIFVAGFGSSAALTRMGLMRHEIAERLGVRYIIEGLVTKLEERFRISVALVDCDSGEQIWGEVFNELPDGTGEFEQRIVGRIAPGFWSKINTSERQTGLRTFGVGSSRYERWWRASAMFRTFQRDSVLAALTLAEELAKEEPSCPFSTSLAAFLVGLSSLLGFAPCAGEARLKSEEYCRQALEYGAENVEVLGHCAAAKLTSGGDLEIAEMLISRALSILPSYQPTLFWGGWVDIVAGRPESAQERLELALRINPVTGVRGPTLCGLGYSLLQQSKLTEAYATLLGARDSDPEFPLTYPALAAAASLLGKEDEARQFRKKVKALGSLRMAELFKPSSHGEMFGTVLHEAVYAD